MMTFQGQFPNISDEQIKNDLLPEVAHWSLSNGLVMYPSGFREEQAEMAPTTLYPTPLPRKSFENAVSVQKAYNELYARISQDSNGWLTNETVKLADFDSEFTGKLWSLYGKAKAAGITQHVRLGIFRSDYLVDKRENEIKQVEFNTVSVSFGGLSTKVGKLHNYLNDSGKYSPITGTKFYQNEIPVSDSDGLLAEGIAAAVKQYDFIVPKPVIAFIVQDKERNVFDQRVLEYELLEKYGIASVRLTIDEVSQKTIVKSEKKRLFVKATGQEIALIYFRAGYSPSDFQSITSWENRLLLETSYAIKAPDLMTQLSGTKKIQQLLTDEEILSSFVNDSEIKKKLLSTFVKIYPLDDSTLGREGKKLALQSPQKFVLKPQREGGGNNIYKEDIPAFLKRIPEHQWSAYILMELIEPEPTKGNIVLRGNQIHKEEILSELGIFGCVVFDNKEILYNNYSGWLLRSKFKSSNEGGVAAGFGCVDSIILV